MFNFQNGIPAAVTGMKALAEGLGFQVSGYYGNHQVAISNDTWNILADFSDVYLCYSQVGEQPVLKICDSPEMVEHEYLHLLQQIA